MSSIRELHRDNENRIDYGIILNVMILAIIGMLSVYSTTAMIQGQGIVPTLYHGLWYLIGAIIIIVIMQFDGEQFWKLSNLIYGCLLYTSDAADDIALV